MKPFDVYPLIDVTPFKAAGSKIWDEQGIEYLDLYGGHAVISIGHSHPHFTNRIKNQLDHIAFYSNSVQIPIQSELASKLGEVSGYSEYDLFLCNSGAEANENALKLASFDTGKKGFISFTKGFHGRTAGAVALTDNPKIIAPFNEHDHVYILPFNDLEAVEKQLSLGNIAGVIVEGIQGVGGIQVPDAAFLSGLAKLTKQYNAKLILDEVQSGYARTGKFFAHQWVENLKPDLITIAKGMGNGYPIGGVLISPDFTASHGLLGTTFGGNHLACAAALAVLEVIESEQLEQKALENGEWIMKELSTIEGVTAVRGKGLMIGFDMDVPAAPVRSALIHEHKIFTGSSAGKNTIRLLPPLNIETSALTLFLEKLKEVLKLQKSTA